MILWTGRWGHDVDYDMVCMAVCIRIVASRIKDVVNGLSRQRELKIGAV